MRVVTVQQRTGKGHGDILAVFSVADREAEMSRLFNMGYTEDDLLIEEHAVGD